MNRINLFIPKPCHENWDNMQPEEKGKFCNACAKPVIDFSSMSDAQMLAYFSGLKNETVCGRAYPDQLNRTIRQMSERNTRMTFRKMAAIFAGLIITMFHSKVQAQTNIPAPVEKVPVKVPVNRQIMGEVAVVPTHTLSGKIMNTSGKAIPFAQVKVDGRTLKADARGSFTCVIQNSTKSITVSASGYDTMSISITRRAYYTIRLQKAVVQPVIMGKMMIRPAGKG